MIWRALGLIYKPQPTHPLLATHAALPVAVPLEGDLVRVFYSGRDSANRSSVGSLILRLGDDPKVEEVAPAPVLIPGVLGAFDDAGIGVGSVIASDGGDRLYYMGWNVGGSVPWRNAIGLAIGDIKAGIFERFSAGPIMDRDPVDHFSLSYPWVVRLGPRDWRMWYGTHIAWGAEKTDLSHAIRVARSEDGVVWRRNAEIVIGPRPGETAVVRPTVLVGAEGAEMWFARRAEGPYRLGYARSADLAAWTQVEATVPEAETEPWAGGSLTYPSVFHAAGRQWLLYNGAGYGAIGFGIAVREPKA